MGCGPSHDLTTPLHLACQKGKVDVVRLLLDKGAAVDRADKDGATPLWIACCKGHVDVVRLLLDKGAVVHTQNHSPSSSPPQLVGGVTDFVRKLIIGHSNNTGGAEVDRTDWADKTPLWGACFEGHIDVVRLLLEKGAVLDRAMEDGATPLSIAKSQGHSPIVALLEEHKSSKSRGAAES